MVSTDWLSVSAAVNAAEAQALAMSAALWKLTVVSRQLPTTNDSKVTPSTEDVLATCRTRCTGEVGEAILNGSRGSPD